MNSRLLRIPKWNARPYAIVAVVGCIVAAPSGLLSMAPMAAAAKAPPPSDCRRLVMRLVPVLDVNNEADTEPQRIVSGFDGVAAAAPPAGPMDHAFLVGKFEVTVAQYVIYLNSVAIDDPNDLYSEHWATDGQRIDSTDTIARSGEPGSYTYSALRGAAGEPMRDLSWRDAIRFVNWLENGCPEGEQGRPTTESGTYEAPLDSFLVVRDDNSHVWLPERDEWLKAGYFSLDKNDTGRPGWQTYSTQSDTPPLAAPDYWQAPESANYERIMGFCPPDPDCFTDAEGYAESDSFYGTRNQGGNVWEWVENRIGVCGEMRGGAHNSSATSLSRLIGLATCIAEFGIDHRLPDVGLRIAVAANPARFVIGQDGVTLR